MRGEDRRTGSLFSYVDLEARVGKDHPLRAIRLLVNEALAALASEFAALYAPIGYPSIPAEKLLRAMLLQAFYSIRSERQLMERLEFDLLFRWFVGLGIDDAVWDHSVFSKNRDRLLEGEIAAKFLNAVLAQPRVKRLLSAEHFSVDGSLIEAWASMKNFKPKDGVDEPSAEGGGRNEETDFHGEKRSNETHASTTDPEARLYRKGVGKEAKLCFIWHALMENRHGLFVDACLTPADGHAERIAALHMIEPRADQPRAITLGADKAYDAEDFVNELRAMKVTPHVAQNTSGRTSAIDGRTTRHAGYAISQRIRKRIEEGFGWIKTIAGQEKTRFRGREGFHLRGGRLQSSAVAEADGGADMSALPVANWSLADRRGRSLGSRLSRSLWPRRDRHRPRRVRRNRLWRHAGDARHRIQPVLHRFRLDRI
jgi:transposase